MNTTVLNFACPKCGNGVFYERKGESGTASPQIAPAGDPSCHRCGEKFPLDPSSSPSWALGGPIEKCVYCGCHEFYLQKDFSRIIGIGLIVIGCILAPFTYYISLLVVSLLDWFLYRRVGLVTVCYGCEGVYRGQPLNQDHGPFQLTIRDKYRFS